MVGRPERSVGNSMWFLQDNEKAIKTVEKCTLGDYIDFRERDIKWQNEKSELYVQIKSSYQKFTLFKRAIHGF